jgi:hypothetical protein
VTKQTEKYCSLAKEGLEREIRLFKGGKKKREREREGGGRKKRYKQRVGVKANGLIFFCELYTTYFFSERKKEEFNIQTYTLGKKMQRSKGVIKFRWLRPGNTASC